MRITIDRAGRIVVPKEIRQRLGLRAGTELEIVDHPDGILLRIPEMQPTLLSMNGLLVHQGRAEDGAELDLVLESVREERLQVTLQG
jgi:AbrB family looped-hinge helix DNA binding protein